MCIKEYAILCNRWPNGCDIFYDTPQWKTVTCITEYKHNITVLQRKLSWQINMLKSSQWSAVTKTKISETIFFGSTLTQLIAWEGFSTSHYWYMQCGCKTLKQRVNIIEWSYWGQCHIFYCHMEHAVLSTCCH